MDSESHEDKPGPGREEPLPTPDSVSVSANEVRPGTHRETTPYRVHVEAFEGPLDLLLHLIKQEKVDILDIPIATITEQYLAYLKMMEELNLNVAGDFVVMAATLIYIKSKMLLPPDPENPAESWLEEDPRKELVYQLLEHQKFKQAAQVLYSKETVESCTWGHPPVEVEEGEGEVVVATLFDVVRAFHKVLSRLEGPASLEVLHEEFTIEQKIDEIRKLLALHTSIRFSEFIGRNLTRRHLIVVFLAILELTRQAEVYFTQQGLFGDIVIHHTRHRVKDLEAAEEMDLESELPED
jgi:segregation and condensation protein A